MNPLHLLARAGEHGFAITVTDDGPQLVPTVEGARCPRDLMADLKRHRAALVQWLTECRLCGRETSDPEDRERLKDCAFCDRAACPYKLRN